MQPPRLSPLTLRDVGEFGLIRHISKLLQSRSADSKVAVSLGDDAAIWKPTAGTATIISTDTMVQDVHFRLETISWRDLGWKAMAMNVSDIAAMGGRPRYALITLGMPPDATLDNVRELYEGIRELCERYSIAVIGGDTVSSPICLVSVTVIGETLAADRAGGHPDELPALLRSSARPGDRILVTGYLGASAAGLQLLEQRTILQTREQKSLVEAHVRPVARVEEGIFLVRHGVRAGADNSDGLIRQVLLFCEASGVGAVLDSRRLPIDPDVLELFPQRASHLAMHGGESYELILTAAPDIVESLKPTWDATFELPLTDIGYTRKGSDLVVIDTHGCEMVVDTGGFDHFRSNEASA